LIDKSNEWNETGIKEITRYEQILIARGDFYIQQGVSKISKFISPFFWWNSADYRSIQFTDYSYLSNSLAEVLMGEKYTLLKSADLLPLRIFNGINPIFSPDGNYLLNISGNELRLFPVSAYEIVNLVDEKKIFGELKYNKSNWEPGL